MHSPFKQAVGRRAAQGLASNASGTVLSMPFMPPSFASSASVGSAGVVAVTLAEEGCCEYPLPLRCIRTRVCMIMPPRVASSTTSLCRGSHLTLALNLRQTARTSL